MKQQIIDFIASKFPHFNYELIYVGEQSSNIKYIIDKDDLREGGTVSGPSQMKVIDIALYIAILGELGIEQNSATTNLNINFLRRPAGDKNIIAECKLIKMGRTLIIGEVSLYSEGDEKIVAHAVGTYALLN